MHSLTRCGEACFNNINCNYFSFNIDMSTCHLKKASLISQTVFIQGRICGSIGHRIKEIFQPSASNSKWHVNENGSFKWAEHCYWGDAYFSSVKSSSITECAEYCIDHPRCNYFYLWARSRLGGRATSIPFCYLVKSHNLMLVGKPTIETNYRAASCGFIPKRWPMRHVEYIIPNTKFEVENVAVASSTSSSTTSLTDFSHIVQSTTAGHVTTSLVHSSLIISVAVNISSTEPTVEAKSNGTSLLHSSPKLRIPAAINTNSSVNETVLTNNPVLNNGTSLVTLLFPIFLIFCFILFALFVYLQNDN